MGWCSQMSNPYLKTFQKMKHPRMHMPHAHAACTCRMHIPHAHAACTCRMHMLHAHAACTCRMHMPACTCHMHITHCMHMPATCTCLPHAHTPDTCTPHAHATCTCTPHCTPHAHRIKVIPLTANQIRKKIICMIESIFHLFLSQASSGQIIIYM